MKMYEEICMYILNLKMYVQNILRWIWRKICVTSSVKIAIDGEVKSVYWRYLMMYIIMLFKFMLIDSMYQYFCNIFDVKADIVQVVKNVEYVDRYVIYENKDNKHAIRNTIKFLEENKDRMKEVVLTKKIILKCALINVSKEVDLKSIFSKYTNVSIDNHTIENILIFNNLRPSQIAKIRIVYRDNFKIVNKEIELSNVLKRKIDDLCI